MIKIINDFLKSKGIQTVLRQQKREDVINVLLIDFLGKDDKFYSFMCGYNATEIFTVNNYDEKALCSEQDNIIFGKLEQCIKCFETKNAFLEGKWSAIKEINFSGVFEHELQKIINALPVASGNFSIVDIHNLFSPIYGFVIYYKYNNVFQEPIIYSVFQENVIRLRGSEEEFTDLMNMFSRAGINNIRWEFI